MSEASSATGNVAKLAIADAPAGANVTAIYALGGRSLALCPARATVLWVSFLPLALAAIALATSGASR